MRKKYLLRKPDDFRRVRNTGQAWTHPLVILSASPNRLPYSRFGFVASKRIGKAVSRNRARRLMREAVRLQQPMIRPGWDLVFIARQSLTWVGYHQVAAAITALCREAGLLDETGTEQAA